MINEQTMAGIQAGTMSAQQDMMLGNSYEKPSPDSIKWLSEPSPVIAEIENYFRGRYLDETADKWIEDKTKRMMNDLGVSEIIPVLRTHLNKNMVQSNLTIEDIKRIAYETKADLIDLIFLRHEDWDLPRQKFNLVLGIMDHQVFPFLTRCKEDGERQRWQIQTRRIETDYQNPRNKMRLFNSQGGET